MRTPNRQSLVQVHTLGKRPIYCHLETEGNAETTFMGRAHNHAIANQRAASMALHNAPRPSRVRKYGTYEAYQSDCVFISLSNQNPFPQADSISGMNTTRASGLDCHAQALDDLYVPARKISN
jgi:hypothetical protein